MPTQCPAKRNDASLASLVRFSHQGNSSNEEVRRGESTERSMAGTQVRHNNKHQPNDDKWRLVDDKEEAKQGKRTMEKTTTSISSSGTSPKRYREGAIGCDRAAVLIILPISPDKWCQTGSTHMELRKKE